ncbi:DEAD/DEAH box helicase [Labilibaculum manganireducens]|uniref:DEAD/DEAH box helicase n=1 Tax=Labilibaculum manganireducens TaxID=1940525 RepID=A0A2N3IGK1_9BACT|nr:DEAD/DEAH box helicase [Labilibaculum manganireducens]PKQ69452.1 DEAD/DEAH box helicase [Labilibaculum manganireducens]
MENFKELGVNKDIIKGLNDLNIIKPTQIQAEVISVLLQANTDLIGQAQTGTGKTAAFGIPLLHRINTKSDKVQGLILCPTRELGQQIAKQLFKFTKYTDKIFTESVYGGEQIDRQISALRRPTHIIVATPGRLIDLVKRKAVDLSDVKTVILDEADEMMSMGFKTQLDEILTHLSRVENRWLFSATMPQEIMQIIKRHFSPGAHKIEVSGRNVVNKNIQHQFLICEDNEKLNILIQFLKSEQSNRGVVFCKTKASAQVLAKQLIAKNIPTDAIHGDLKQIERDKVMRAFKNESLRILVATDIAARGIDIVDLSFVVHYELPDKEEYYTHRSGRTARAGKEGVSLALVNNKELKNLRYFQKTLNIAFNQIRPRK